MARIYISLSTAQCEACIMALTSMLAGEYEEQFDPNERLGFRRDQAEAVLDALVMAQARAVIENIERHVQTKEQSK